VARTHTPQYEQRIVLFLDFLGFREIVARTVADRDFFASLLRAIDLVSEIGKETAGIFKTHRITQFSDSVVLSYAAGETSGVFHLLFDVAIAIINLAGMGFLVRGAITAGDLFHTSKYVVGPAMVKAYELESKRAMYPRVLIDPKLLQIARTSHASHHEAKHEVHYVRGFFTKDFDGRYYFDYVSFQSVVAYVGMEAYDYPSYLRRIGEIIAAGFKLKDERVLEKYLWLHTHYLRAIEDITKLPPRHRFRQSEPEICHDVAFLPTLVTQAKRVRDKYSIVTKF
jgi:hypothetical protein